ncbi:MAG: transposase [Rubinisphaera brasiliensis]|uniref:transposase n=1 Tax=Rubinisphaera brasiliensis TaxID=119 RepID=UPI00391C4B7D
MVKNISRCSRTPWTPRTDLRRSQCHFLPSKTGCQWRLLPHDFPHWRTVYGWYARWRDDGTLRRLHAELVKQVRQRVGNSPTVGIIDSQPSKHPPAAGLPATTLARRRSLQAIHRGRHPGLNLLWLSRRPMKPNRMERAW